MSGSEAAWVPWAMGALGGLGGYLGGSRPENAQITGYGHKYPSLHPEALFRGATGDLGRLGALYAQRAQTPVSMPSSYVQPLPMFKGGIVDAFGLGMDPALPRPELQTRGGVNFGSRDALPFQRGGGSDVGSEVSRGGREVYKSSEQPASPFPTFGGAHSELGDMQKALAMLRPSGPPSGEYLPQNFHFSGARGDDQSRNRDQDDRNRNQDEWKTKPQWEPEYGNPNPQGPGNVTDSSGQIIPVDPLTGQPLPRFPDGTIGPLVGSGDPDGPGSSVMPPDALWGGREDMMHPFSQSSTSTLPSPDMRRANTTPGWTRSDELIGQPYFPSTVKGSGAREHGELEDTRRGMPSGVSSSFLPQTNPNPGPFFPFPGNFDPNVRRPTRKTAPTSGLPPGPFKSIDRV